MAKLTIRAIAKMANVSPTAVSFVINGKKGVSGETRKNVEEIIKQTNFRPNLNSRRLSSNRSFNIAIIMANKSTPLDDLFYLTITRGVLQKSKEYGYNIVFTDISTDVPLGPLSFLGTSLFEIPMADSSFIFTILSPASSPILSDGDPGMGEITVRYASMIS